MVSTGTMTFISGGVRSGKSAYAESLLTMAAGQSGRLVYIASGQATDQEMQARIRQHQVDRAHENWQTIEQPTQLENVLHYIERGDFVLWDCMTTWLANELYEGWESGTPCITQDGCMEQKAREVLRTIEAIANRAAHFVIVSNEVLNDSPSRYKETRIYQQWLGTLHQQVVALSTKAIEMESGIPIYWKGEERT